MTDTITREEAEALAKEVGVSLEFPSQDGMPTVYAIDENQIHALAEKLISAKLKEWAAQGAVAYLAWKDGKPCYEGDDGVCEEAVWPLDETDDRTSMPVYTRPLPAQPAEQPIKLYADSGNPDMFSRDLLDAAGNRYIVMTPTMTQFDIDDTALRAAGLEMKIDGLDPAPDGGSRAKMYWRKVDGAQPAEPVNVELVADMFWNDDDAERNHNSIDEFLNEEICNGMGVEVGGIFTLRRATSLPKIKIRVTSIDEEACEAEYEIIDALSRTQAAQPQHKEG